MAQINTQKIKILIVDDHTLFNDGLATMLKNDSSLWVVGQVYNSKDALYSVQKLAPDIVLLDFNMPYLNGLQVTELLLKSHPELKILVLSMYNEIRFTEDFRKAGAKGYILKTADLITLTEAVHKVAEGGSCFENGNTSVESVSNHSDDDFVKKYKLTPREIEILQQIKKGLTSQQIADRIFVSPLTVETHRKNIHFKLGIKGQNELFRWLLKQEF
jgi:DNA-binding NarL/FixJ family response regulator